MKRLKHLLGKRPASTLTLAIVVCGLGAALALAFPAFSASRQNDSSTPENGHPALAMSEDHRQLTKLKGDAQSGSPETKTTEVRIVAHGSLGGSAERAQAAPWRRSL